MHTADVALVEGLNAIWKHTNILKEIKADEALTAMEDLIRLYDKLNIITARESTMETAQIALTQNIAVYDAVFIAATQKLNGTMLTADQKLHETANRIANSSLLANDN